MAPFLLPDEPVVSLEQYRASGGGEGLQRARGLGPGAVIGEIALSGLRGRGGAGFPTGRKWASVRDSGATTTYVVCNAAEGEPATFKDRALLRANPYQVLEGLLIAAIAVEADGVYLALKASFLDARDALERAAWEITEAGWTDQPINLVAGPEEYLFGEEKALLEVIEGNDPLPRWLPPYLHGLFADAPQLGWESRPTAPGRAGDAVTPPETAVVISGIDPEEVAGANPTVVNNVETLANVAHILRRGPEWFRTMGTDASPGSICVTLVGDVAHPAVVEVDMGTPLSEVLGRCGGLVGGQAPKAILSGVANAVLTGEHVDTPLTYEHFEAAGGGLGSAGFAIYGERTCMVEVAAMCARFLWVESCGQCPPCKLGTGAITAALERILDGTGTDADLDRLERSLTVVTDGNRCYLPVEARTLVSSILRRFPEDVARRLESPGRPHDRELPFPKIVALSDGVATYDRRQALKRPDWTYPDGI
jgi:NADH-quinone oxidoreductase subunit F